MLELTLNEQKQINGGAYRVDVMQHGRVVKSQTFRTYDLAQAYANVFTHPDQGITARIIAV